MIMSKKKQLFCAAFIFMAIFILVASLLLFLKGFVRFAVVLAVVDAVVLFLPLLLCGLNFLVKRTQWYRNAIPDRSLYPTNEWYREHSERNFDVVNIGSSSAKYAFDYSDLPVKAFNWGEQPQSLSNGFKILKTYFSILRKGGTVVISLCPLSGLDVEGKWGRMADDKYFYTLPPELIPEYVRVAKRRRFPLLYSPKASAKALVSSALGWKSRGEEQRSGQHFVNDAWQWLDGWKRQFAIASMDAPLTEENQKGQEKRVALLSEILTFCEVRGLHPVLVIPPIHGTLSRLFSESFRENYIYSFVRRANRQNVPFLNYMDDKRFQKEEYFRNSFFMSEEGAKAFTKVVLKEIGLL